MQRSIRIFGLVAFASLVGACSSDSNHPAPAQGQAGGGNGGQLVTAGLDAGCTTGSERCACYGNGTCAQGLTCASDLCVRIDGGQAGGGAGGKGTGGAAGSSGGTGVAGSSGTTTGGIGQAGTSGGTTTGGIGQAGTSGGTTTGGIGQAGTSGGTATGGIGQAGTSGGTATGGIGQAGTSGGTATGGMANAGTSGTATGGVVGTAGSGGTAGAGTGGIGVGGNGGSGGIRIVTETEPNDSWSLPDDLGYGSVIVLAAWQGTDPEDPG